jgi:hypothetical protein
MERAYEMSGVFVCGRMYLGDAKQLPWTDIFGITTLELG